MSEKLLSTSALAKEMDMSAKELFNILLAKEYIQREAENWILTQKGRDIGGTVKSHPRYGEYIAWDDRLQEMLSAEDGLKLINATTLSKHFNISKLRINPILSELGLIQKEMKGWIVTKLGESMGGKQFEYDKTGIPYVSWYETILTNKRLIETIQSVQGQNIEEGKEQKQTQSIGFREKFEAKHRAADGHYVRSRAEMLIDNWLYMSEIVHAYERKLPVEEELYCDFYLPIGKVYIEYWGMENDERYVERKRIKLDIYNKYGFKLIELEDADIQNLDDILPKKLLKYGIQAY